MQSMKISVKYFFTRLDKQFFGAFLLYLALSALFLSFFLQNKLSVNLQLAILIGLAFLALIFFFYTLWRLNRSRAWVSLWAAHPIWVYLTFMVFPILLILLWNQPIIYQNLSQELTRPLGTFQSPHFLFMYFWQALVFGIAFLAHPNRKKVLLQFSRSNMLLGLLLGLGSWGIIMFANEIFLQRVSTNLPYLTQAPVFWAILPMALLITPPATGYFFFYALPASQQGLPPLLSACLRTLLFCLLPFRIISLFPAFLFSILFNIFIAKKAPLPSLLIAYAIFNLCMLLLNWQWVL